MKTILVPTDFSRNAKNALDYAIAIAKKQKAKIILLHAYNITYISPDIPMAYYEEQLEATESEVNTILEGICAYARKTGKIQCESVSREGVITDVILAVAAKKKADLLVMGTKGASGVKAMLMGSNTEKVISKSKIPVIAVPEKASFEGIKNIAFATDFHSGDINSLDKLVAFATIFKAKVQVVHMADDEYADENGFMEKFSRQVKKKIAYKSISYDVLKSSDEKKLQAYLKKKETDVLSITTRDRTIIERLFGKSMAKKFIFHTRLPLIVFHYKR